MGAAVSIVVVKRVSQPDDARGCRQRHDLHVRRRHHQLVGIALVEHFSVLNERTTTPQLACAMIGAEKTASRSRRSCPAALRLFSSPAWLPAALEQRTAHGLDAMSWHRARGW